MKTRTKLATSIIAIALCIVSVFAMFMVTGDIHSKNAIEAKVRIVETSQQYLDAQNWFDEFDEHTIQTDENGFDIVAKKYFDKSILSEMDLVGLDDSQDTVTVRYEVTYVEVDDAFLLTVTMEGVDDIPVIETIPGLVSHNISGEPDVMFVVDGEYVWLSELKESGALDEVGLFSSWLKKVVNKVVKAVVTIFKPIIRLGSDIAVALLGRNAADIGAAVLNMTPEVDGNGRRNGIYHANFDCWQQHFGYIDLYDTVFDAATSMRSAKFPFSTYNNGKKDYILWAWKGDYLTLGAGAELGIYTRWRYDENVWKVDKSLAMTMTLKLDYNQKTIIDWQPTAKQWWITGFNYNYQHVKRDNLKATYTVTFNDSTMSNAFNSAIRENGYKWSSNGGYKYTYSF